MLVHFSKVEVNKRILRHAVCCHADNAHSLRLQPVRPVAQRIVRSGEALEGGQELGRGELLTETVRKLHGRH